MSDLRDIPISDIHIAKRAREDYGGPEFLNLKQSIQEKGLLQPITVSSEMQLLAGGRRLRACSELEWATVPALVRPASSVLDAKECELFENIHRKDMTWQERDQLVMEIHDLHVLKHGEEWTQNKTAALLDKSIGGISMTLKRARAAESIPELKEARTAHDAQKLLNKIEETALVQQMAQEIRDSRAEEPEGEEPQLRLVDHADSHYRVGDALEGLADLVEIYQKQESNIALFEVDPPYAIDLQRQKMASETNQDLKRYEEVDPAEYYRWLTTLYERCYNAAGVHCWMIAWFGPTWFNETKLALMSAGWSVDDMPLIWTKTQGQTQQPDHYLGRAYEMAFIARKGQPLINKRGRLNVFQFDPVPSARKYHPTQRPIALMKELLATFGFPGQVVCIPFLGSGSTLKAVYQQEMMGFGWDLSQENKDHFLVTLDGDG